MNARSLLAVLATAAMVAACGGDDGPKPGTLQVVLNGTSPTRSVKFRLVGPTTGIAEPGTGPVLAADTAGTDTLVVAVFAPVGTTLNGAAIALISVPDVGAIASYVATPLEVAAPSYSLLGPSVATLTFVQP